MTAAFYCVPGTRVLSTPTGTRSRLFSRVRARRVGLLPVEFHARSYTMVMYSNFLRMFVLVCFLSPALARQSGPPASPCAGPVQRRAQRSWRSPAAAPPLVDGHDR